MNIIGINGRKRSGKDTSCHLLCEHINGDLNDHPIAVRAAFADKLKIMAAKALGYDLTADPRADVAAMNQYLLRHMDIMKEHGGVTANICADGLCFSTSQSTKITGREYLQLFGGKAREVFGDTFWVDQVLPKALPDAGEGTYAGARAEAINSHNLEQMYGEGVKYVVITDVRYPNEAERVHALGGEVWEILRPDLPDDGDDHATEQPLPRELIDVSIINDGSIDDLRQLVIRALEGDA